MVRGPCITWATQQLCSNANHVEQSVLMVQWLLQTLLHVIAHVVFLELEYLIIDW